MGQSSENGADLMMIGFMLAIGFSHVSHAWFGGAWDSMVKFFPVFVGYFLVAHSPDSKKKLEGLITVVILCTVVLAVAGIVQYHTGSPVGGVELLIEREQLGYVDTVAEYKRIRWLGPFSDPNDLALAFVLVIPFLLNRLAEKKYLFPLLFLPPVVYALYLTNSRGAVLALAISIMTFFIIRKGKWKGALLALVAIVLIVLFGPSRMGSMSGADESAHGRLEAWYQGYQILKENPFFGGGSGTFLDFHSYTAHNSLVLVFAELGLLGAFFFIGLFYFPLERMLSYLSKNRGKPIKSQASMGIYSAMIASLFGVLTAMFFLSRSYTLMPYMVVGMMMNYSLMWDSSESFEKPEKSVSLFRHIRNIGIAEIGMILMINLFLRVFL
jgi:putative inorganic carbon (hco3(-)) transporter